MHILNDEEIHLKFLLNLPVHVEGIGDFHAPLLDEIVNLTELKYNHAVYALLLDKKKLEQDNLDQYSDFEVVSHAVLQDSSLKELFFCALKLHFGKEPSLHIEQGFPIVYFDELSMESVITEEKFNYIRKLATIANNITPSEEEEYKAGNEQARKLIEKMKKKKAEAAKYKKPKINLHSLISAVGWKAQSFEFISRLNIYQLYDGYGRYNFIDNYHYTMQGVYAGTVDAKGIKLPDINWANIIQTK